MLRLHGFSATFFTSPLAALAAARSESPDLVISDVETPDISGIDSGDPMRAQYPKCKILPFLGQATTMDLLEGTRAQGYDFRLLRKPCIHLRFSLRQGNFPRSTRSDGMDNNGQPTVVIADDNREILKVWLVCCIHRTESSSKPKMVKRPSGSF